MIRVLQILTVLVFVAVMYGIHQGAGSIARLMGTQFSLGFGVGVIITVIVGFLLHWIDRRSSTTGSR